MRNNIGLLYFITTTFASYCGRSGVPFSVEVLQNGAPVLGCAQPSCAALPEDGIDDSVFQIDVQGQPDGFFRDGDRIQNSHLQANKMRANCSGEFNQLSCSKKNQWVGGIEYIDHPRQPLVLQCCSFEGLRFSQEVGVTTISAGEAVTGGEVIRDGRQISFDVIANVRKVVDSIDHSVSYEVTVRRMNCLPDPPEVEVVYDNEIAEEILRVLGTSENRTMHQERYVEKIEHKKPRRKYPKKSGTAGEAFGAPIYNPIETPREEVSTVKNTLQFVEDDQPKLRFRTMPTKPSTSAPTTTNAPIVITTTSAPETLAAAKMPTFDTFSTLPPFHFPTFPPIHPVMLGQPPAFGQGIAHAPGFGQHSEFGGHGLGHVMNFGQPQHPNQLLNPFQNHNDNLFRSYQPLPPAPMAPANIHQFGHPHLSPLSQPQFQHPQHFGLGQPFGGMPQNLGFQNPLYQFTPLSAPGFGQQVQAGAGGLAKPLSGELPGFEEHPEVINPILNGPVKNELPDLFTPPPFLSLPNTLNNFKMQG